MEFEEQPIAKRFACSPRSDSSSSDVKEYEKYKLRQENIVLSENLPRKGFSESRAGAPPRYYVFVGLSRRGFHEKLRLPLWRSLRRGALSEGMKIIR